MRRPPADFEPTKQRPGESDKEWFNRVRDNALARSRERTPEEVAEDDRKNAERLERRRAQEKQEAERDRLFNARKREELDDLEDRNMMGQGFMWMRRDAGKPWWPDWLEQHRSKYPELSQQRVPRHLGVGALTIGLEDCATRVRQGRRPPDPAAYIIAVAQAVHRGEKGFWGSPMAQKERPDLVVGPRPRRRRFEDPEPPQAPAPVPSPHVKRITRPESEFPEWREPGWD